MRFKAVVLVAVGLASAGVAVGGDAKADQKKLQGTWEVVVAQKGGKDAPADEIKQLRFTFSGDKLTVRFGKNSKSGVYKIDPSKKPAQMDVTIKDDTMHGIYRFKGEQLEMCASEPGAPRPAEFKAPEGSAAVLVVLKRTKD